MTLGKVSLFSLFLLQNSHSQDPRTLCYKALVLVEQRECLAQIPLISGRKIFSESQQSFTGKKKTLYILQKFNLRCKHTFHRHSRSRLCTSCLTRVAAGVLRFELLDVQLEETAVLPHLKLPAGSQRRPILLPLHWHSKFRQLAVQCG